MEAISPQAKPARLSLIEKIGLIIFGLICIGLATTKGWGSMFVFPAVLIMLPIGIIQAVETRTQNLPPKLKVLAGFNLLMIFIFSVFAVSWGDSEEVWSFGFVTTHVDSLATEISSGLSYGAFILAIIGFIAYAVIKRATQKKSFSADPSRH